MAVLLLAVPLQDSTSVSNPLVAGEGRLRSSSDAQEGPAELKFPAQIFIRYIYCIYGAHEHLGGAFSNFGSQAAFLCSASAESDTID